MLYLSYIYNTKGDFKMRKKIIMSLFATAMSVSMLAGCGSDKEITKVDDNTVQIEQSNTNTESDTTVESTEEILSETETEEVKLSFLEENGFVITPCGEMVMPLAITGTDDVTDVPVVVSIEIVPSEEDGYSDTTFTVITEATDTAYSWDLSTFDRYTGYELATKSTSFGTGGSSEDEVYIISADGVQYDCTEISKWEQTDNTHYMLTVTIHHPSEYDGLVFSFGKYTASISAVEETIDYSTPFQITDYPERLDGKFFFTATNN